jgi:hypothetical protein
MVVVGTLLSTREWGSFLMEEKKTEKKLHYSERRRAEASGTGILASRRAAVALSLFGPLHPVLQVPELG